VGFGSLLSSYCHCSSNPESERRHAHLRSCEAH
jgi:hypothetical protein